MNRQLDTEFPVKFVSAQALKFALENFHQSSTNPELMGVELEEVTVPWATGSQQVLVANLSMPQYGGMGYHTGYAEYVIIVPLFERKLLGLFSQIPMDLDPLVAAPWALDVKLIVAPDEDEDYTEPDDDYLWHEAERVLKNALDNLPDATFDPKAHCWMIGDHTWEVPMWPGPDVMRI